MIYINDEYGIQADEKQYTLVKRAKRVDKDTGEACWGAIGHYGSMSGALEGLSRRLHRQRVSTEDMGLDEAVMAYHEIRDSIMGLEDAL